MDISQTASSSAFPAMLTFWFIILMNLVRVAAIIYLFILLVRALRRYLATGEIRKEKAVARKSLGEALKEERLRCQMTQEFVAERLGVSRQAVSKWENGTSDPSTSNLLALARLYGVDPAELLRSVSTEDT